MTYKCTFGSERRQRALNENSHEVFFAFPLLEDAMCSRGNVRWQVPSNFINIYYTVVYLFT